MRMPRVRFTVRRMMLLVAAAAALLGLLFVLLGDRTVEIQVANITGRPLVDVMVVVGSVVLTADRLAPGSTALWTIRPSGYRHGTSFSMEFHFRCRDDLGRWVGLHCGASFDPIKFEPQCRLAAR